MDTNSAVSETGTYVEVFRQPLFIATNAKWCAFARRVSVTIGSLWVVAIFLGGFAPGIFGVDIVGGLTIGLVVVLASFATTIGVSVAYLRFANRTVDPAAQEIEAASGVSTR